MSMQDNSQAVMFMGDLVVLARQARLIREASRRGYAPVAVVGTGTDLARLSALSADPAHPLADLTEVLQVPDAAITTVLPAVQPLLRRYDIRGVISVGEVFVEPAGVLANCLGLPGAGTAASLICRNKLLQRTALPEFSPWFEVVPVASRAGYRLPARRFPVVVKPAGRFYSSGVRQVADQAALTRALAAYGEDEIVLVESRVVGQEFSVEAMVQHGAVIWSAVTGKQSNEHDSVYFTETSHTCPAVLASADAARLVSANTEILRRIGMGDGFTHAEYRLTDRGVVLMEVAARLPGDAITFLWELATGQSVEPVMIDLALGVQTSYPVPRRRARQQFLDHPHGILRDVTADGIPVCWHSLDDRWPQFIPLPADAPARAHAVLVGRVPGDRLGAQVDSGHRSACVIVDGPLQADLDLVTQEVTARVAMDVAAMDVVAMDVAAMDVAAMDVAAMDVAAMDVTEN
jgi:biotin carboxylase